MIKIIIDEYKDSNIYDVFVSDGSNSIETVQGLTFFKANEQIEKFIIKYDLSGRDLITNNVYDDEGYLLTAITEPVKEFMQGSMY
jgi:hypothetical protein